MFESNPIFSLLSRALDRATLRQSVHVANIANASTEGYSRLDVTFDAALQTARAVRTGDAVRLDQEVALMAKDAVHHQALLGAFERTSSMLRFAIREGREG